MSDIKLFRLNAGTAHALQSTTMALEKSLQTLIEGNLETLLGMRLLASEYVTGEVHRGRIDTLALDEDGAPVIIEYKRSINENVINQGLFYLDWLLDHKGEFELLVHKTLGPDKAEAIEWASTRLLCIAADFTRYDDHAVRQINRNIELIRYRQFEPDMLLLELATRTSGPSEVPTSTPKTGSSASTGQTYKTMSETLKELPAGHLADLLDSVRAWINGLGDDVEEKLLKYYLRYRRLKNFATLEIRPQKGHLLVFVKVDPGSVTTEPGFTRDVSEVGHLGVGDLEITIGDHAAFERAQPLIQQSYEAN